MAWFKVRGGNHVKPTFFRLSGGAFLASGSKGRGGPKVLLPAPPPSVFQLWPRRAGDVEEEGLFHFLLTFLLMCWLPLLLPVPHLPSHPRWFFYSDFELYHGERSRGFSFAVPPGVNCSLPPSLINGGDCTPSSSPEEVVKRPHSWADGLAHFTPAQAKIWILWDCLVTGWSHFE